MIVMVDVTINKGLIEPINSGSLEEVLKMAKAYYKDTTFSSSGDGSLEPLKINKPDSNKVVKSFIVRILKEISELKPIIERLWDIQENLK